MSNLTISTKFIQLNDKTAGKEKVYRTIQYASKLFWYLLWKTKSNKDYIDALKKLEATLNMTRKVFRLGKTHDMIEVARKCIHIEDDFLRYILTASAINQACYFLVDNALLLEYFGFIKLKNSENLSKWTTKFWLATSIFALARDLYEILNQIETNRLRLKEENKPINKNIKNVKRSQLRTVLMHLCLLFKTNPNLMLDTTKNVFDVFLPLSFLKFIDISPGTQGFVGVMSSLLSLVPIWDSKYKLTP